MNKNFDANINNLIIGFLTDNNTSEDNKLLKNWLEESEENKKIFRRIQNAWISSSQTITSDEEMITSDLAKVHSRIKKNADVKNIRKLRLTLIRIAASIIILLGLSSVLYDHFSEKTENKAAQKLCRIVVPKGSKTMAQLPDGSTVWLNAESSISYNPASFDKKNRTIDLMGEGYFSVTTNPEKPFIVKTKDIKVKAYGTEFNVKSYPENVTVETTLIHGIVKVEGKNQQNQQYEIQIKPKQKLICYTKADNVITSNKENKTQSDNISPHKNKDLRPVIQEDVKTVLYTSWKDENWIIEGEKIGDLAINLERRYNVLIKFQSEEIKNYMFTGTFQNETFEQVMQVIRLTAPIQYTIDKGEVTISLDERLKLKYEKYIN